MTVISRQQLAEALVAAGVSGPHQSHTRSNAIGNLHACIEGDPDKCFGLSGLTTLTIDEVLGAMADLTGCSPDALELAGYDTIDPARTIAGAIAAAERLRDEARRGATLLTCTGHPTGVMEMYVRIVDAFREAGGKVLRLREEERLEGIGKGYSEVRYVGGVGCLADWGQLKHTHSAAPMQKLLEGEVVPDLVLGDHGWAGAAIERGIPTIAIMDINDPALAAAWLKRRDVLIVALDDNRPPRAYEPLWELFEHVIGGGPAPE